mgnify:CR=1 FL=1
MKRFKEAAITMLAVCLFAACGNNEDIIWDVAPINLNIYITDSEGHDLLDSTFQDNLINDLTVNYQEKTYPVMTERQYYAKETRYYMPHFSGLMLRQNWNTKRDFRLVFGEFPGDEDIDKLDITLNLPDGRQTILSFKNSFRWKSNGKPNKKTVFYLDGQELKDDSGKQGSYHFQYSQVQALKYIPNENK